MKKYRLLKEEAFTLDDGERILTNSEEFIYDKNDLVIEKISIEYNWEKRKPGKKVPISSFKRQKLFYNTDNKLIKIEEYNKRKILEKYYTYEYDEHGNQLKYAGFRKDDSISMLYTYEFDNQNRMHKKIVQLIYPKIDSVFEYLYENGKKTTNCFNSENKIKSVEIEEFNQNGDLIKHTYINDLGKVDKMQTIEYRTIGIKEKMYIEIHRYTGEVDKNFYVFLYDQCNNLLEFNKLYENGKISTSQINEYDINGNKTKEKFYTSGERDYCTNWKEYTYEEFEQK